MNILKKYKKKSLQKDLKEQLEDEIQLLRVENY